MSITVRQEMPAQLFAIKHIQPRVPEPSNLYRGNPDLVWPIMKEIFPEFDFSSRNVNLSQVFYQLEKANTRLRTLNLSDFNDSTTVTTVAETISMAYRTRHPLAFKRLGKEMAITLSELSGNHQDKLPLYDIGYGPGTVSMALYDLAEQRNFKPNLTGVDLSAVHQAMANYLYPPSRYRVNWTVGDGTNSSPPPKEFPIATAFDVGHHLTLPQYSQLVDQLVVCSTDHVLISDPTNYVFAREIVRFITRKDPVNRQAVDSFNASHPWKDGRYDLNRIYCQIPADTTAIDTGFMFLCHVRLPH